MKIWRRMRWIPFAKVGSRKLSPEMSEASTFMAVDQLNFLLRKFTEKVPQSLLLWDFFTYPIWNFGGPSPIPHEYSIFNAETISEIVRLSNYIIL